MHVVWAAEWNYYQWELCRKRGVLVFCQIEKSKKEICEYMGYRNRTFFTRKYLTPLLQKGQLQMTQPDKPNSRNQKYITGKSREAAAEKSRMTVR